MIANVFI